MKHLDHDIKWDVPGTWNMSMDGEGTVYSSRTIIWGVFSFYWMLIETSKHSLIRKHTIQPGRNGQTYEVNFVYQILLWKQKWWNMIRSENIEGISTYLYGLLRVDGAYIKYFRSIFIDWYNQRLMLKRDQGLESIAIVDFFWLNFHNMPFEKQTRRHRLRWRSRRGNDSDGFGV